MRKGLILVAAAAAIAAAASQPQKIVLARVFPNAGQIGLFIASADGTGERPLLAAPGMDYDAVWSPDGASIVFTSDREGSADLRPIAAKVG
jgi:TolB protein